MIVIEVPKGRGMVFASMGRQQVALPPVTVSRLIEMYREAQTVAMQERGDW